MEFINKIEIRGLVGSAHSFTAGGKNMLKISVCTERRMKDRSGNEMIEVTWFNVSATEGDKIHDTAAIRKGNAVHVKGHIRNMKYTDSDGSDRYYSEIVADSLEKVERETK